MNNLYRNTKALYECDDNPSGFEWADDISAEELTSPVIFTVSFILTTDGNLSVSTTDAVVRIFRPFVSPLILKLTV